VKHDSIYTERYRPPEIPDDDEIESMTTKEKTKYLIDGSKGDLWALMVSLINTISGLEGEYDESDYSDSDYPITRFNIEFHRYGKFY